MRGSKARKESSAEEDVCMMTNDDEERPYKYPEINVKPRISDTKEHSLSTPEHDDEDEKKPSLFGNMFFRVRSMFKKEEEKEDSFDNVFGEKAVPKEKTD